MIDNIRSLDWWLDLLAEAQIKEMIITVTNNGDDYTEGFSFDIFTYVVFTKKERDGLSCKNERFLSKERVNTQSFSFSDLIKSKQTLQKTINVKMTISIPSSLEPEECGGLQYCSCKEKITYVFENLDYEKFP